MNYASKAFKRRVRGLESKFLCPYWDASPPGCSEQELRILEHLANGVEVLQCRHYIAECDRYAVSWSWELEEAMPSDWAVTKLLSRQMVRTIQCFGGMTKLVLTDAAEAAIRERMS